MLSCQPREKPYRMWLVMLIGKLQDFDFYSFIFPSFNFSKTKYGTNIRLSCNNIKQCLMYSEVRLCLSWAQEIHPEPTVSEVSLWKERAPILDPQFLRSVFLHYKPLSFINHRFEKN